MNRGGRHLQNQRRLAKRNKVSFKIQALLPAAALALALTACLSVGPDYKPPALETPTQWNTATGLPAEAAPPAPDALNEWWRQFDDPVLDALVTEALANNLDLAGAQAKLREARARSALTRGELGPTVGASGAFSRNRASAKTGSGKTRELYRAGFDASWEIDIFGGLRRELEAAKADFEASTETLRDTRVSLVAEVVLNYVDLCAAERRLAIAEAGLAARRETHQLVDWREQAGLASQLDVAQALTDLETVGATLPTLRTAVVEAQNRLSVLLGHAPGAFPLLHEPRHQIASPTEIPVAAEAVAVGIPAETLRQRPDVRAAERRLAAQTARLGVAEAARYPRFELSGSIGLEALTFSALGNHEAATHSLLGSITAPIFESGRISANIAIQDALLEQAELDYRSAVLTALEDVENALVSVSNTKERHERLQSATTAARTTFEIAEQRYATGLIDFLAVLDSQRTLLGLEDQLAGSTLEFAQAQIQLYKALGGGWSPEATTPTSASEAATEEP